MLPLVKRAWALALIAFGCGDDGGGSITVTPSWSTMIAAAGPNVVGHNAVWSRGGLGLWDDGANAPIAPVMALVSDLHPGVLRFPGGTRAMRYHFDQAIGPIAQRMPQCDPFTGTTDATHYGVDEFLLVAQQAGAEVTLVAPWVDGTPEEAAALVAYVNADPSSTVMIGVDANGKDWGTAGSWATRRVQNGHAAPYGVKYLEIGNEQYHDLPVGPAVSCGRASTFRQDERWIGTTKIPTTAADHATQVARYAMLVHAVDPNIKVGASAYSTYDGHSNAADAISDLDMRMGTNDPWDRRLLTDGGAFDFFILHPYDFSTGDYRITLADKLHKTVDDLHTLAPGKGIAITEYGFLFDGGSLLNAIVSADVVRVSIEENVLLALRHILIEDRTDEPFADSAAIAGPDHQLAAGYQVMRLLARNLQPVAVSVTSSDPDVVALATRNEAGDTLALVVIDRRTKGSTRGISLALPQGKYAGTQTLLTAPQLTSTDVSVTESPASGTGTLSLQLPAHSLIVVRLSRI
jgi:hypothetical protein